MTDSQIAKLALEDGTVFTGRAFGASGTTEGEVVFNTSMTGYQEILTDPSYKGQIVTMTYPLIGNYGINRQDVESKKPHVAGFIVKELSPIHSNWRAGKGRGEGQGQKHHLWRRRMCKPGLGRQTRHKGGDDGGVVKQ